MAAELLRFLFASATLILPGVLLTKRLGQGTCVGLALAVYMASLCSQFNLPRFYPAWRVVAVLSLITYWLTRRRQKIQTNWLLISILLLVAITRFAVALPQVLPEGIDPQSHLILTKKIFLTQHAIGDWMPFDAIALNYPMGSHTLIAVLATISGLPLHVVYKDLIPLLGVLTTAQIFQFTRLVTRDSAAALFAAMVYGMWAGDGSINYYVWGGLPNELAMLFLIALLTAWLEDSPPLPRAFAMSIELAAIILTHHHVLLVSGAVIAATLAVSRWPMWRPMLATLATAAILDGFFLVSYVQKALALDATHAWRLGEPPLRLSNQFNDMGYVYVCAAAAGAAIWFWRGRRECHAVVICACVALVEMFIAFEYLWPLRLWAAGLKESTAYLPSRFLNDLNYFLAVFAGMAIAFVQRRLRLSQTVILAAMLPIAATLWPSWRQMAASEPASSDFLSACAWIETHTSPSTIVLSDNGWSLYLCWRRGRRVPASDSDPVDNLRPQVPHIHWILAGLNPPDAPDMKIVQIQKFPASPGQRVLWRGDSGLKVVQLWPK